MEETKQKVIAIIGGDSRQAFLAGMLAKEGYIVIVAALEKLEELSSSCFLGDIGEAVTSADIIILPMPVSKDGVTLAAPYSYVPVYLNDIWAVADSSKLIVGGMIDAPHGRKLNIVDYGKREEFSILNAIPTAEAAIEIAIRETKATLFGSECMVVGYGKIGKVLTRLLIGFGAEVTACARKEADLAWIKAAGAKAVLTGELHEHIEKSDIIFNTVPHPVINRRELAKCKKETVIIDLASAPGGTDFGTAEQLGIKTIWALSLPGKTAPVSAAGIVKDTILSIIREENIWKE